MIGPTEPISAISNAFSDLALLITKALPSDEQKLAAFKLRSPRMYARIKQHILRQAYRWLRQHKESDIADVTAYVNLISNDAEDRKNLLELLNDGVNKNNK